MSETQEGSSATDRKGHRTRWIVGAIVVILVIFVVVRLLERKKPARAAAPQVVKVAKAARGDMPETLSELGTVSPVATVTVLPQLSGYLTEVGYKEGQEVKKGQFLAQIDPRQYEIDLEQAQAALLKDQASLDQAHSDLSRYHELRAQKAIAEQTVTDQEFTVKQDEAQVKSDEANIAQFKLDLIYCRITAPVAGRVGLRLVDPGQLRHGLELDRHRDHHHLEADDGGIHRRPERSRQGRRALQFGRKACRSPPTRATTDREIATGTLYALGNQMATSTGTVTLRADFANEDEALFPNEFVNVKILVDTLNQAVLVPTPAVLSGAPGDYVYLVNADDTVSVRKVDLGPSDGRIRRSCPACPWAIPSSIDGTDRLSDGAKISVAPAAAAAPAAGASTPTKGAPPGSKARRKPAAPGAAVQGSGAGAAS